MQAQYPTRDDWEQFLASPDEWAGVRDTVFLGTIADVFQIAEERKKGGSAQALAEFQKQFQDLRLGPICEGGTLHILDLDLESLRDAAFEVELDQAEAGSRLWTEIATKDIRPWRTIRRLILRPLEHRWFGEEPYLQMEAYFGQEGSERG